MKKFAFICHPFDVSAIRHRLPWMRMLPGPVVEMASRLMPPVVASHITGIRSSWAQTEGWLIGVPLTAKQMVTLPERTVLKRITQAMQVAQRLGAQVAGLGVDRAAARDGSVMVGKNVHIPVTTGYSYTIGMALAGLELAAVKKQLDLKQANVFVPDATSTIGSVCSRILARKVNYLTISGRNSRRLERLSGRILRESGLAVQIAANSKIALAQADLVLIVPGSTVFVNGLEGVKKGALVCDLARPRAITPEAANRRPDVLVMEGGMVRVPGSLDFGFDYGFPPRTVSSPMAETMILALEGRSGNFTVGNSVFVEQIDEIMGLGDRHGFKLAGLHGFDRMLHFS